MEPITITRDTKHIGPDQIGQRVGATVASLTEQMQLTTRWEEASRKIHFESVGGMAKGTKGHLQIGDGWIQLIVHLTMILNVQRASVEQAINEVLDSALQQG